MAINAGESPDIILSRVKNKKGTIGFDFVENKLIDCFNSTEMEFQYGGQSNIEAWVVIE